MSRSRREHDTRKNSGSGALKASGLLTPCRFDFGWNWQQYSLRFLNDERVAAAATSLEDLIGAERIRGRSLLDIGCGTGIFSIAASRLGAAHVVGFDVDEMCVEVARLNADRFCGHCPRPEFFVASILSDEISSLGRFDVVYAWGSLHHTGDMARAIDAASKLVAPRGLLVLAIYNRHFTSPVWRRLKRLYNILPEGAQKLTVCFFAAAIFCAKLLYTFRNPLRKRRGMSFFFDVVDWLGGYPYEYASREEIEAHLLRRGFQLEKFVPAPVPTGCNEFIFRRAQQW